MTSCQLVVFTSCLLIGRIILAPVRIIGHSVRPVCFRKQPARSSASTQRERPNGCIVGQSDVSKSLHELETRTHVYCPEVCHSVDSRAFGVVSVFDHSQRYVCPSLCGLSISKCPIHRCTYTTCSTRNPRHSITCELRRSDGNEDRVLPRVLSRILLNKLTKLTCYKTD